MEQLKTSISRWHEILQPGERSRHIRRIKATGCMRGEDGPVRMPSYLLNPSNEIDWDEDSDGDSDEDEDVFTAPTSLEGFRGSSPIITPESNASRNTAWVPLARFLRTCAGLRCFVWASTDQVPLCILDVLHNQLHVNTFSLRSLYQRYDNLHNIDADEYALVTSPSLTSICVASVPIDEEGRLDYNEEAIEEMVAGLAPKLRSSTIWYPRECGSVGLLQAIPADRPEWQGFFRNRKSRKRDSRSQLVKLAFKGEAYLFHQRLEWWDSHIDYSILSSLHLRILVERDVLKDLICLAEGGVFQTLRHLSLRYNDDKEDTAKAKGLISALASLQTINLHYKINEDTITTIIENHGGTLRRLHCHSSLVAKAWNSFRKAAPN
ncbi:hypothetical protein CC80DRAFT_582259 [Byssothecium circinans]|uniref:F-box domain-containing protein n=1 Tax=Byssothecium circinans TaxID=147558 RepID=A0A6A5U5Q0_9PLEO|nr:hypothetical protein CC80DRAFT_582259 [Byssothecium circinans]